uniref:Si:ch1073-475a24.1 n=1 Tax=Cyprinus carpio TaxID=7962 RepID=A0A8C2JDK7_CYPCA
MTVLDALNTNKIFRKIKKDNNEKEIVIQKSKGAVPRAAIKTDFPCCLIERHEVLDISFIKNHGNVATKKTTTGRLSISNESKSLVIFYIKTKGGKKITHLMKNNELRKKVEDVCVYAFKDDKLNAALRRDGRFINAIFKKQCVLYNLESETNYEMSKTVEHLDGKHFEIIVISDYNQPDSQDFALKETQKRSTMKSTKPQIHKTNSPKIIPHFSEVYKIKQLMRLSDSVCQIRVEGSARGTGFLLFGRFVLTNAHVVKPFLESPDKLSSTKKLEAAFDFERLDSKVKLVPVKKQLAAYCYITDANKCRLDFALLELEAVDEITGRPELLRCYSPGPPPKSGEICIVGHPDCGIKKTDPCFIIETENLQESHNKHISENVSFLHVMTQKSIEDKWDLHENQINYNSCFFHGSSGSPVFDEHCCLIGVHTGGYTKNTLKAHSLLYFLYSVIHTYMCIRKSIHNNFPHTKIIHSYIFITMFIFFLLYIIC